MKSALVLAVAIGYAVWKLAARFSPDPEFDARNIYLPFAKKLLDSPAAFLASEQSLWVAPFSYIYPALLGADAVRIKVANIVLFVLLILLVFRIGTLLHSRTAGLMASVMLAASPTIKIFIPSALTEPPFLFLTGVWVWALAEAHRGGRDRWWVLAGLALGLATLTRPTFLYLLPLAIAAGAAAWWCERCTPAARDGRGIALAHAVALAVALAVIVRNALLFDYPGISTGAGAGLFLGSNPMTGGYDAAYLGLLLDDGAVTGGKSHLAIESDRLLRGVALTALADIPVLELTAMYARKLGAILFVTQAETGGIPEVLRGWRVVLLVLAAYGWWHIRVPALKWLLGGAFAYQLAVHIPALYTFRYSIGAIDLPLTLIAGAGAAQALANRRQLVAVSAMAVASIGLGQAAARYGEPPSPHVDRVPHAVFWKAAYNPPLEAKAGQPLEIELRDAPGLHPWDNSILELAVSTQSGECRGYTLWYRRDGQTNLKGPLYRRTRIAEERTVAVGTRVALDLYAEGTLRVEGDCASGASLRIHGERLTAGRFATYYADKMRDRGLR